MRKKMKRSQIKLATRKKLLEVAESAFVKSNFKASTFKIARDAKVAHGTIFFHYKNRDELVLTVVKRLVLRITDALYLAYKNSLTLKEFLTQHFETVRVNWSLFKALLTGFSEFNYGTKQEVISLLSVINYYLVEAFNKWTDTSLVRTVLWQSTLVYLSFLGEYMFDKKKISEKFIKDLLSFITGSSNVIKKGKTKIAGAEIEKKLCWSCGMLLNAPQDYTMGDTSKHYCQYCTDKDGTLRPYGEVLNIMTTFLQKTQVLNIRAARQAARAVLAKNPAWKGRAKK